MIPRAARLAIALAAVVRPLAGQAATDSSYAAVQARGAMVMGVDQYTSHHVFEDLPDGGRIVLVRNDSADTAGAMVIRRHLRSVADSFGKGVFSAPEAVHAREVPGTAEMARLRDQIVYIVSDRAGGGEIRMRSGDATAVQAIHEFLAFQRMDHRAAGHEGMEHMHHQ
jgi:hypothetical protein